MSDEPRKLAKQPLSLVLAEFRFSTVLKIEEHIPSIQECLRHKYPVVQRAENQTIRVSGPSFSMGTSAQWQLVSPDLKSAVIVDHERLVLLTSEYERFPDFSERCMEALNVIGDVVKPGLLNRIGLRYNDLISFEEEDVIAECVDPQLLPNSNFVSLGMGVNHHRVENVIQTEEGTLILRSLYGKHGLAVMPDINQALPISLDKEVNPEKYTLILDFDHAWVNEKPGIEFDLGKAKELLGGLHERAREAFWAVTTEHARTKLWD